MRFIYIFIFAICLGVVPAYSQALDDAAAKTEITALSGKDAAARAAAARKLGASRRGDARRALADEVAREKTPAVKRAFIEAMAEDSQAAGDAAVVEAAKTDPDAEVRASAAWTLGFSTAPAAYRTLIGIMLDTKEKDALRVRAASSLSNFRRTEVFNAYLTALADPSAEVRRTAAMMAATVYGDETAKLRPYFTRLSSDTDPKTAAYAAATLAAWNKRDKGLK